MKPSREKRREEKARVLNAKIVDQSRQIRELRNQCLKLELDKGLLKDRIKRLQADLDAKSFGESLKAL